jgi:hypothetical protein
MEDQIRELTLATFGDSELTEYLVELFENPSLQSSSSLEESRQAVEQIIQSTYPRMGTQKRNDFLDSLLDKVAAQRQKELLQQVDDDGDDQGDAEIEAMETNERDGSCQLCGAVQRITIHHLIPKLVLKRMRNHKKGKVDVSKYLVEVCRPCHNVLHKEFGHGELAKEYQTVDMLLQCEQIQPYLLWKRKRERTLE